MRKSQAVAEALKEEKDQLERRSNPRYSLEKSKTEYIDVVAEFRRFVSEGDDLNPVDWLEDLDRHVRNIGAALSSVQDDIRRVSEADHPGWVGDSFSRPRWHSKYGHTMSYEERVRED